MVELMINDDTRIISRLNHCLVQTVRFLERVGLYAGFFACLTSLVDIVKFHGRSLTGCSLLHHLVLLTVALRTHVSIEILVDNVQFYFAINFCHMDHFCQST
jgi:hypothetical protein